MLLVNKMKSAIHATGAAIARVGQKEYGTDTLRLFQVLFYCWLLYHTFLLIPHHQDIFGEDAIALRPDWKDFAWHQWITSFSVHPAALYLFFAYLSAV